MFTKKLFAFTAFTKAAMKLVGDGESSEDGGFLRVDGAGSVGDGAHFFIHIRGKFLDVGRFEIARDGIGLAEDVDSGG